MMRLTCFCFLISVMTISCKKDYDSILESSLETVTYIPVAVEQIASDKESIPIYGIGRLSSDKETKLSFKTGGFISRMSVEEGAFVKKGSFLGALRTDEIDAQVLKAQRALEKSTRDLARVEMMYKDSVATLENVEDLTTLVEVNKADFQIAKFNQTHSKIVSPVSGRVLKRMAEPNELVAPGQPIYLISSGANSYIMKVAISDKDINMMNYGTSAEVTFDAFNNTVFEAKVEKISESANPVTGLFDLELNINNQGKRLRNGMIGKVAFSPITSDDYVKIPIESISEGVNDIVTVYVPVNDTLAKKIKLEVAHIENEYVWVTSDQIDYTEVITKGSAYLSDKALIRIVE